MVAEDSKNFRIFPLPVFQGISNSTASPYKLTQHRSPHIKLLEQTGVRVKVTANLYCLFNKKRFVIFLEQNIYYFTVIYALPVCCS